MRVEMITLAAGPERVLEANKRYELEQALAIELIEAGYARPVKAGRETATVEAPETAVIPGVDAEILDAILERFELAELAEVPDGQLLAIEGLGKATLKKIRAWTENDDD